MSRGVRSSRPHRHGNAQITQQQALAIVRTEPRSAHAKIARSDEALAAQARESAADLKALAADIQDTERASNSFVPTELPERHQPRSADQYAKAPPSCWAPPPQNLTVWFCRAE